MLSEFGLIAVGLSDSRMKIEIEVTAHTRLRQLGGGARDLFTDPGDPRHGRDPIDFPIPDSTSESDCSKWASCGYEPQVQKRVQMNQKGRPWEAAPV